MKGTQKAWLSILAGLLIVVGGLYLAYLLFPYVGRYFQEPFFTPYLNFRKAFWSQKYESWRSCVVLLPGYGQLDIQLQLAHPFLAEYDEKLVFEMNGKKKNSSIAKRPSGYAFTNIFLVQSKQGDYLKLDDEWPTRLIDLKTLTELEDTGRTSVKETYLGRCDVRNGYQFISPSVLPKELPQKRMMN